MDAPVWTLGLAAFAVIWAVSRCYGWYRLRHIPGPFGTGWSNLWLWRHQLGGRLCEDLEEVCNKYGMPAPAPREKP